MTAEEASPKVDEAFSTLARLKMAAFLAGCDEAEFKVIAATTGTAPSALSKAATSLENSGYLTIKKGHVGRRPRTWLSLTSAGRAAFSDHLQALEALTERARSTADLENVSTGRATPPDLLAE